MDVYYLLFSDKNENMHVFVEYFKKGQEMHLLHASENQGTGNK